MEAAVECSLGERHGLKIWIGKPWVAYYTDLNASSMSGVLYIARISSFDQLFLGALA